MTNIMYRKLYKENTSLKYCVLVKCEYMLGEVICCCFPRGKRWETNGSSVVKKKSCQTSTDKDEQNTCRIYGISWFYAGKTQKSQTVNTL